MSQLGNPGVFVKDDMMVSPSVCQDGKPGEESNKYTGGVIYVLKERVKVLDENGEMCLDCIYMYYLLKCDTRIWVFSKDIVLYCVYICKFTSL